MGLQQSEPEEEEACWILYIHSLVGANQLLSCHSVLRLRQTALILFMLPPLLIVAGNHSATL